MTEEKKAVEKSKKEREPKPKAAPKTKGERRKAWNDYRVKNAARYLAWSRGHKASMKISHDEFNRRSEVEHAKKTAKK
jgi:hypothetical protein